MKTVARVVLGVALAWALACSKAGGAEQFVGSWHRVEEPSRKMVIERKGEAYLVTIGVHQTNAVLDQGVLRLVGWQGQSVAYDQASGRLRAPLGSGGAMTEFERDK